MGLPEEEVKRFLGSGIQRHITMSQIPLYLLSIFGFWCVGLLFLFLIGMLLSNFTLRSLELQRRSDLATRIEPAIKACYRFLIYFGGFYYYFSLPVILVLIIVFSAGLIYIFLMIGTIPIYFMGLLLVGAGFSIYGMIRSLFVKVKYQDPGKALAESDAPGLFDLVREVAKTMETRPIDEIRVTPYTDFAVYERGTRKDKYQDNAKRILILGMGTLKDFKENDFRAILAHEYGHFSHRDTAGGYFALKVQNDIHNYFYALYTEGQNVWWNVAFQFLRLYNFIFLRISHGATRLQEVLADRVAAQTYGAESFQDGLTYLIRRRIEFVKLANLEIDEVVKIKRPINNLYGLSGGSDDDIEKVLQAELNRTTSAYDTHPSPADRFHYMEGISASIFSDNSSCVDKLFMNWESLTAEMTATIEEKIK
jgi:Zn-dependent protease with chaperone function